MEDTGVATFCSQTSAEVSTGPLCPETFRNMFENVMHVKGGSQGPHLSGISPTFVTEPFELLLIDWLVELPVIVEWEFLYDYMYRCIDKMDGNTLHCESDMALESARFFMEQIVMKFGAPLAVATDNGQHFKGEFDELLEKLHVAHHWGSPYHPQSTGWAEKTNGLIMARIRRWLPEGDRN